MELHFSIFVPFCLYQLTIAIHEFTPILKRSTVLGDWESKLPLPHLQEGVTLSKGTNVEFQVYTDKHSAGACNITILWQGW